MSINIVDFNIANQILDNEFRNGVLEKQLEKVLNSNRNFVLPTPNDIENFRIQTAEEIKKKYPNSALKFTKKTIANGKVFCNSTI